MYDSTLLPDEGTIIGIIFFTVAIGIAFTLIAYFIQYWLIRFAVRHALRDARKEAQREAAMSQMNHASTYAAHSSQTMQPQTYAASAHAQPTQPHTPPATSPAQTDRGAHDISSTQPSADASRQTD